MKLWFLVLLLLLAACTKSTPAPVPGAPAAATTVPVSTSVTAPPATSAPATSAGLFLNVTGPQDESSVTTSSISVTGETIPDAVVTVNGTIAEVEANGRFQVTVDLTPGPNVIEVVASDFFGNRVQELRTVILVR